MLIINTTFFVTNTHQDLFLSWLNDKYVPRMLGKTHFSSHRFYKVLAEQEPGATAFSLQFEFAVPEAQAWHEIYQPELQQELRLLFDNKVLSFSTLLEQL